MTSPLAKWRFLAQSCTHRFSLDHTGALCVDSSGATSTLSLHGQKGMPPFDEIVVGSGFLNAERTGDNELTVWLGPAMFSLWVTRSGNAHLRLMEGTLRKDGMIEAMSDADVKRAVARVPALVRKLGTKQASSDRDPATIGKIVSRKGVMGGAPCIAGTRISTAAIWSFHQTKHSVAYILRQYPTLHAVDVLHAVEFERERSAKAIKKTARRKKVSNVVDTTTNLRKMKGRR